MKYNSQALLSTDLKINRSMTMSVAEQPKNDIEAKRIQQSKEKELERHQKEFQGFIQRCYDARILALKDPEVMPPEEENSLSKAIANNIKF